MKRVLDHLLKHDLPLLTKVSPACSALIIAGLPVGFWLVRQTLDNGVPAPFFYATLLGDNSTFILGAFLSTEAVRAYGLETGKWERLYRWPQAVSGGLFLVILVPIYLNWKNGTTMDALPEEQRSLISEWLHTLVSPAIGVSLLRLALAVFASKAPWKIKLPIGLLPTGGFILGLFLDVQRGN